MRLRRKPPWTWTAIGDSLTAGTGDLDGSGGWVQRAATRLPAEVPLKNLAVHGATSTEILDEQLPYVRESTIVSAIAGANDMLGYGYRAEELDDRIRWMFKTAFDLGDIIVSWTHPDFFARRFRGPSKMSVRIERLNELVRTELEAVGDRGVLIDAHTILGVDGPNWHADGVHPSPEGHAALALDAVAQLQPKLLELH